MRILLAATMALLTITAARADDDDYIVKNSQLTVPGAVAKIEAAIEAAPPTLMAKIDHGKNAKNAGLDFTESVLLVFGAPKVGTPIMRANPLAGLDLPVKVLVWNDNGQTKIGYLDPEEFDDRYDLDEAADAQLEQMAKVLEKITSAALK